MSHPNSPAFLSAVFTVLALFAFPVVSPAESYSVETLVELQSRIEEAVPGDIVTLKNGTYVTTSALSVTCRGTAEQPITIAAETVGGVEIGGTHGFNVGAPASHVVISGFKFTHASGKASIGTGTRHVRFTRNTFRCTGAGPYLAILGHDVQIDRNDFGDKRTTGAMIAVSGPAGQVAQRLWIHRNYFHDFGSAGGEPGEMLRFGLSALTLSVGAGVVEYNLFVRCRGENDMVSNRCSGNTYRYNTFADSPTAQFSLRHGNDCVVYGNIVRNTEGLRIFGDRHQVFSNVFEGNYIGVNLGNGSVEVADGGSVGAHDRPDHCVIAFNTFVDNRTHYQMSRRNPNPLGATHTVFANNILQGGGLAAKIEGPYTDPVWEGNLAWNTGGPGDLPADAYVAADPRLGGEGQAGVHLQEGSPAIDAATGSFPSVIVDIDGQPRGEMKDVGADEMSEAPVLARTLTPEDVGPAYD